MSIEHSTGWLIFLEFDIGNKQKETLSDVLPSDTEPCCSVCCVCTSVHTFSLICILNNKTRFVLNIIPHAPGAYWENGRIADRQMQIVRWRPQNEQDSKCFRTQLRRPAMRYAFQISANRRRMRWMLRGLTKSSFHEEDESTLSVTCGARIDFGANPWLALNYYAKCFNSFFDGYEMMCQWFYWTLKILLRSLL